MDRVDMVLYLGGRVCHGLSFSRAEFVMDRGVPESLLTIQTFPISDL